MADGNNFRQAPPRKPSVLQEFQLRLTAAPVQGSNRAPTLAVAHNNNKNQLELVVYTNVEGDKDNGKIIVKPSYLDFEAICDTIHQVANGQPGSKATYEFKASRFVGGKPSDEPMTEAKVVVGKDNDGKVFIAVLHWNKERPMIKFHFGPKVDKRSAVYVTADGASLSAADISAIYARGWANLMRGLVNQLAIDNYTVPAPRENSGGQRQSWGQGGGNRGGGAPAASSDFGSDDDFPM